MTPTVSLANYTVNIRLRMNIFCCVISGCWNSEAVLQDWKRRAETSANKCTACQLRQPFFNVYYLQLSTVILHVSIWYFSGFQTFFDLSSTIFVIFFPFLFFEIINNLTLLLLGKFPVDCVQAMKYYRARIRSLASNTGQPSYFCSENDFVVVWIRSVPHEPCGNL